MSFPLAATAALVDAGSGERLVGDDLRRRVLQRADQFEQVGPGMAFVVLRTTMACVLDYLAAVVSGRPVLPLAADVPPEQLAHFATRFRPALVLDASGRAAELSGWREGPAGSWTSPVPSAAVDPRLALCLTTSGSTGSPKLVRLSRRGLEHNTRAIVEVLDVRAEDVAITSLPLNYSYGLSVLNSHLLAGATTVLTQEAITGRAFWNAVDEFGVTTFAGVPQHYRALLQMRFVPADRPALRNWTQAGGRLAQPFVRKFSQAMATGQRFYVMYGQTEAGPRMTTLPAGDLADAEGTVGPALPGGELRILTHEDVETTEPGVEGEVVYRGPNVMMGYADDADGLARGDECGGVLRTGDLGRLDHRGYLHLSGRAARSAKVFGTRVNLDDLEAIAQERVPQASELAVTAGDDVVVVHAVPSVGDEDLAVTVATELAAATRLHRRGFQVRVLHELPRLSNGKVDYRTLERSGEEQRA